MDTFFRFLYEFLMQFFSGVQMVFSGFINGIAQAFNYKNYVECLHKAIELNILSTNKDDEISNNNRHHPF